MGNNVRCVRLNGNVISCTTRAQQGDIYSFTLPHALHSARGNSDSNHNMEGKHTWYRDMWFLGPSGVLITMDYYVILFNTMHYYVLLFNTLQYCVSLCITMPSRNINSSSRFMNVALVVVLVAIL